MPREAGADACAPRFRYCADFLFLTSSALYLLNRFLVKPYLPRHEFLFRGHFNDLLLIPAVLPLFLITYRLLGLRRHDNPPTWRELLAHLVMWSFVFEIIGPRWLHRGTADPWDILFYAVGGGIAWWLWQRRSGVGLHPFSR